MGTSGASPSNNQPSSLPLTETTPSFPTGKTSPSGSGNVKTGGEVWLPPVASASALAQVKPFTLADLAGKFAQGGLAALTPDEFASLATFAERAMNDRAAFIKEQGGKADLLLSLAFTLTADLKAAEKSGALAQYLIGHKLNGDAGARNWQKVVADLPKPPAINDPDLGRIVKINTANHRLDGVSLPFVAAARPMPVSYYVGGDQVIATDAERAEFDRLIAERLGLEPVTGPGFEMVYEQPPLPPSSADTSADVPLITWPETPLPASAINLSGDPEEMLREDGLRQAYASAYQTFGKLNLNWPPDLALPGTGGSLDANDLPAMLEEAYNRIAQEYMTLGLEPPFMLPSSASFGDPAAWRAINATIDPVGFEALRHGETKESYALSPLPGDDYVSVKVPGFGEIQALQSTQNPQLAQAMIEQRARLATLEANLTLCQTILGGLPPANWFQERMAGAPPSLNDINYSLKAARVALAQGDMAAYYREYHEFQTAVTKFNSDINKFLGELAEADETVRDFVTTVGTVSMAVLVVASVVGTGGTTTPAVVAGAMRLAMAVPIATTVGGELAHSALTGEKVDFSRISMSVALTLVAAKGGPMVSALMKRLITLPGANQLELAMLQQVATNLSMGAGIRGVAGLESAIRAAQAEAAARGPLSLDEISELVAKHVVNSVGDPQALTIDVVIGALGGVGQYRMTRNAEPLPATSAQPRNPVPSPEPATAPKAQPATEPLGTPTIAGKPLSRIPENDNATPGGQPQYLQATGSDDFVPTQISPGIRPGANPPQSGDLPIRIVNAASNGGNNPPKAPPPAPAGTTGWTAGGTMPSPGAPRQPAGSTMPSPNPQQQPPVNLTAVTEQLEVVQGRLTQLLSSRNPPAGGSTIPSPGQGTAPSANLKDVQTLLAEVDASLEQVSLGIARHNATLAPVGPTRTTMPSPDAPQAPRVGGSTMPSPGMEPVNLTAVQEQLARVGLRLQPLVPSATPTAVAAPAQQFSSVPPPADITWMPPAGGATGTIVPPARAGTTMPPPGPTRTTLPSPDAPPPPRPGGSTMPSPGQEPVDLAVVQDLLAKAGLRLQTLVPSAPPTAATAQQFSSAPPPAGETIIPQHYWELMGRQPVQPPAGATIIPPARTAATMLPPGPARTTMPSPDAPQPRGGGSTMPSPDVDSADFAAVQDLLSQAGLRLQPLMTSAHPTAPAAPPAQRFSSVPPPEDVSWTPPAGKDPATVIPPARADATMPPPGPTRITMLSPGAPPARGSTMPSPGMEPVDLAAVQKQLEGIGLRLQPLAQGAQQGANAPSGPPPRLGGSTMPSPGNERSDTIRTGPPSDIPPGDTIPSGPPSTSSAPPPPSGSTIPSPGQEPVNLRDVEMQLFRAGVRMQPLIREATPPAPPAQGANVPPPAFEPAPVAKTMIPPGPDNAAPNAPDPKAVLAEAQHIAARAEQRAGRVANAGGDAVAQTRLKIEDMKRTIETMRTTPGTNHTDAAGLRETMNLLEQIQARLERLK